MIKKLLSVVLIAICVFTAITSCASNAEKQDRSSTNNNKKEDMKIDGKKLVVFFSHTGENYGVGHIEKGNTHILAEIIADKIGADIFEIKPVNGYPEDSYDKCVEIAKKEKESKARPAIKNDIDIDGYDVIFIGYPNWWSEPPTCVFTFTESHDWTGKTVIPFITHEGSGMGSTDRRLAASCKGADVAIGKGLALQGHIAQNDREATVKNVDRWLKSLGLTK